MLLILEVVLLIFRSVSDKALLFLLLKNNYSPGPYIAISEHFHGLGIP